MELEELRGFEKDYMINKNYPHEIIKKNTNKIIKEYVENNGYYRINLNGDKYSKHRIIAKHFISNPDNLPEVDHINHDRTDNRIENLRWCSSKDNCKNKTSNKGIKYNYINYSEFNDEDLTIVDKYKDYEIEDYYYNSNTNKFYYDTGVGYKELHINYTRKHSAFVNIQDKNNKFIKVFYNEFKREQELI